MGSDKKNQYAGYWIRRFLCEYLVTVKNNVGKYPKKLSGYLPSPSCEGIGKVAKKCGHPSP